MVQKLLLFCRPFCVRNSRFRGGCARETFGSAGSIPGSPTCVQLPPNSFGDKYVCSPLLLEWVQNISRYMPLTGHDSATPSLHTDTLVPQDFDLLCAIALCDGCDLLDVISRRLQA